MLGSNIGTCITAVLAAIGSNIAAKRVAAAHVLFNLIGTIIFMIILVPFTSLMLWLQSKLSLTPEMTIAFSHGSFNITNTILLIPFISLLAMIVTRLIPGEDEVVKYEALYLDRLLITQAPSIALGNAHKELVHLASYAIQAFEASYSYIMTADDKFGEKVKRYERAVDTIDEELTTYLVDISNEALSPSENEVLAGILDSSRDLERIGDHSESLGILIEGIISKQIGFSISARQELTEMYQLTHCLTLDAIRAIVDSDTDLAQTIVTRHKEIEEKERRLRKTHIKRLNCGECTAQAGINFIDIISHYTRITDHALNLAEKVLSHQL